MRNIFKLVSSIVFVGILAATMAFGQSTTGSIGGTVKDPAGAVIPGATVNVKGVDVGFNQTVTSTSGGTFYIDQLPIGRYKVTVSPISGFAVSSVDAQVVIGKTTTADVNMGIAQGNVNVEVGTDPLGVVLDTTDSKLQTNITSELLDKLPSGTSFASMLKVSPATRSESLTGGFTVDGASKAENSFVVDGQDITNYRYGTLGNNSTGVSTQNLPTALIKEVQVKTSGFEAEHGGASGAVVVVATKSGSDEFHGEFGTQFTSSKLQPGSRFTPQNSYDVTGSATNQTLFSYRSPTDQSLSFDPTASLGGAIIKKHLWFYTIYSPQTYNSTRVVTYYNTLTPANGYQLVPKALSPETYTYSQRYEYAEGRLDYSLFNKLNGFTTYLWNPFIVNGGYPSGPISVGGSTPTQFPYTQTGPALYALKGGRNNSNVFNTQMSWTATNWFALSGRFGYGFENSKPGSYAPNDYPRVICSGVSSSTPYTTGATQCPTGYGWQSSFSDTGATLREVSKRKTYNVDGTFFFGALGKHNLKGGYELAQLSTDIDEAPLNRIVLYYGRNPASYIPGLIDTSCWPATCIGYGYELRYGEGGKASNKAQALYVQDKWQIGGRLTLNLGVRMESENLPSFSSTAVPISIPWAKKTVPRLGGAFDLFGNGKTRLFASYGIFSDRLKFELPIGSFGGALYNQDYYPILASHPEYTYYTQARIYGNWPIYGHGNGNPSTMGGLAQTHIDYRPISTTGVDTTFNGVPIVGVDPNLKPFKQQEMTFGVETELSKLYVFSARFTQKKVLQTIEDIGVGMDAAYTIGNPGEGIALKQWQTAGYAHMAKPERVYNALEIQLTKRFSNNYFFSANYTLSRLYGNYSGLANSDYFDGGSLSGSSATRSSPGVNRFYDWSVSGYTAYGKPDNGPLATDRTHVFKAYGGYTWDWWHSKTNATDISFFTSAMSGTPQTTSVQVITGASNWIVWKKRGDMGRTPTLTSTDMSLSHSYKFGRDDRFKLTGDITVTNIFNQNTVTSFNPRRWIVDAPDPASILPGYPSNPTDAQRIALENLVTNGSAGAAYDALDVAANRNLIYGQPSSYQPARSVRFGFRLIF